MAKKIRSVYNTPYTPEELLDTANAMDEGILGSVKSGTVTKRTDERFLGMNINQDNSSTSDYEVKSAQELGSILGQSDLISTNRKKRLEQQKAAGQGIGSKQSILGGGSF